MRNTFFDKCSYLRTPMGAVKLANVVIGAISLILVAISYVPVWTLAVFIGTVVICLCLSIFYLAIYLFASQRIVQSKANRVTSFIYHVLAGTALIVAGIELIGWSDYDASCKRNCPHLYTVGIAKTLTFMNGTLYLIVGFLGIKDDDMLDPESAEEDIPLLQSSNDIPSSIPGKGLNSSLQGIHFAPPGIYDPFQRQKVVPPYYSYSYCDDARGHPYLSRQHSRDRSYSNANSYHLHPHHYPMTVDQSFNNSYNSTGNLSGIHFTVAPDHGHNGHPPRRPRTNSMGSNRSARVAHQPHPNDSSAGSDSSSSLEVIKE